MPRHIKPMRKISGVPEFRRPSQASNMTRKIEILA
jgi:hypothetical protein